MPKKYVVMLKEEQSGLLNDLIRKLGTVPEGEKITLKMGNITAKGSWKKDVLLCEFNGLIYTKKPDVKTEDIELLEDKKTVCVGKIVASSNEL